MLILLLHLTATALGIGLESSTPLPPIKLPFPPVPLITMDAGPHAP